MKTNTYRYVKYFRYIVLFDIQLYVGYFSVDLSNYLSDRLQPIIYS